MSFDALAWAAKQNPGSAALKLVLLGLAECASRPGALAFPSTAALVEFSSLDRKTVIKALDDLEREGFITDTGRKAGRTQQIKVFQLNLERLPKTEGSQKREAPKNGHERLPKTGHGISKGISSSRAKALSLRASRAAITVDQLLEAFAHRFTPTEAHSWAKHELGWTPVDARQEWERFVDSARAHGRVYKDWAAAWRSWCRSPYCKTKSVEDRTAYRKEPLRV